MKTLVILILFALIAGLSANQEAYQQKKQAEVEMGRAIAELQKAKSGGEAAAIQAAQAGMQQAELQYRHASRVWHQASLRGLNEDAGKRLIYNNKADNTRRRNEFTTAMVDNAASRPDITDEEKANFLSSNEASLRAMHIDNSINENYVRQFKPVDERMGSTDTQPDRIVDSKAKRMSELMSNVSMTNSNRSYAKTGFAAEADQMARRVMVEQNLREFTQLATSREFRNTDTGELLSSPSRAGSRPTR